MNPENEIAVRGIAALRETTVINANLYFFSWGAFAACLFLTGSLMQESAGIDLKATPRKTVGWTCLTASSLVVMGSAVRIFKTQDCNDVSDSFCKRTKFAVSLGAVGFFLAGILTVLAAQGLNLACETASATLMLCLWCFGLGYLTFGESPGNDVGNLYFATWFSFIICVFLFGQCFREFMGARATTNQETTEEAESPQVPEEDDI